MKVVALAGGVGGAKLAHGLSMVLPAGDLTVVVNTGDDMEHLGLHISPDVDTVMYTLCDLSNPDTGWGVAGDTFEFLAAAKRLGAPGWFNLGDRDLATHIERTRRLRAGESLTDVTAAFCSALGCPARILPMSDDPVRTKVSTDAGLLDFQDYFVARRCEPVVSGFSFEGIETARPSRQALDALSEADAIVICPSNPFVSVAPIIALEGMREAVASKPTVAVSPIVGGEALKGPAAKMMVELGLDVSATGVADRYRGLIGGFALDSVDASLESAVAGLGMSTLVTNTVMRSEADRAQLAREVLAFAPSVRPAR
jgi:LPPG:FO 2-phospho-L-lactate transferase